MLKCYKCFEPGQKSPVLFILVILSYKSNHFILQKGRGYIYIFSAIRLVSIPLRGLSQSTPTYSYIEHYFPGFHLFPQFPQMFITLLLPRKPSIMEYPRVVVVTDVEPHLGHLRTFLLVGCIESMRPFPTLLYDPSNSFGTA